MLVQKQHRGCNMMKPKKEHVGALLTPIFQHCGVDLSRTECQDSFRLFDEAFWQKATALKTNFIYQFTAPSGEVRFCQLPISDWSSPTSRRNVEFNLPLELQCPDPTPGARTRGGRLRRTTTSEARHDGPVPALPPPASDSPSTEYVLPPYSGEFDLPETPAGLSMDEKLDLILQNQHKNSSMMKKIWGGLAKLTCPRPPSCFRSSDTRGASSSGAAPTDTRHAPADDGDDEDSDHEPVHRHRQRRQPGQDFSDSYED